MLRNKSLILLILSFVLWSCDKKAESPDKVIWGSTDYYESFMFKKYEPVIMKQTLEFDFNDDAKRLIDGFIEFEPVVKNENNEIEIAKGIILYKNSEKCENNILKIKPDEKSIELGIEFTGEAKEGSHTIYLRVKNANGLDRIDDTEISMAESIVLAHEWVVKKDDVFNPLGLLLFWIIVTIIVILTACFIASRIINPRTKFSKLYVDYQDGTGERKIEMHSAFKLLCTNQKTNFSVFYKFFVGIVKVEVNDFWTHPVTITSGRRNSIKVSGLREFQLDTDETIRKEPFTITNENLQKVTITTT